MRKDSSPALFSKKEKVGWSEGYTILCGGVRQLSKLLINSFLDIVVSESTDAGIFNEKLCLENSFIGKTIPAHFQSRVLKETGSPYQVGKEERGIFSCE